MSSRTYSSSSIGTSSPASSSPCSTPHRPSLSSNFSFSTTNTNNSSPHTSPANSRRSTSRSPIPLQRHDSIGSCSYRSTKAENNPSSFGHPLEEAVSRMSGSDESESHFGIGMESFENEDGIEAEEERAYRSASPDFLGFEKDDWNPYTQEQRDRMNTDQRILRYCAILKYHDPQPFPLKESSSHVEFSQGPHETESEYNSSEYGHESDSQSQPPVFGLTSLLPIPLQQQLTPRRPSHQRTSSVASTSHPNQNLQPSSHSHSLFKGLRNRLSPTRSNANLSKLNQRDKLMETWNLGRVSGASRGQRSSRVDAETGVSSPPRYGVI